MTTENTNKTTLTSSESKPRATPIPQGYDRILQGALKLSLKERADISNALIAANKKEAADLKAKSDEAAALTNGTA